MSLIRVPLGDRAYAIHLVESYASLPAQLRRLKLEPYGAVISHRSLLDRFGGQLLRPLKQAGWQLRTITVPESEQSKSSAVAERVLRTLASTMRMRTPTLFAFGGGVVGDLTGFVAAVFRRGVPYVQLPTTLLAQVDSAIGGKVGVDLQMAKNLVGAFHQPRLVMSHLGLPAHLPIRQRRSGLSEIIKYGVIADPVLFRFLEEHLDACLKGTRRADRIMVERSCRIKARIVAKDERDATGLRAQLNFGHTLGHALEAATGYRRFTHGEAIAVGMAYASHLSVSVGLMPSRDHERLVRLVQRVGLPTTTSAVSLTAVKRALRHDKKFIRGRMRWVLPTRIGRVIVTDSVSSAQVWRLARHYVTSSS